MIRLLRGRAPTIGIGAFVHTAAEVIGHVSIGARASVWPGAVLRGDSDAIHVGAETNVQDGAVLHADPGFPCRVGAGVTVGHRAIVHGCTVEDGCLIGMGAIVMNGARIGTGSIVGAGALVPEGAQIPPGSLVRGVPGRVARTTTPEERAGIAAGAARYVANAALHRDDPG